MSCDPNLDDPAVQAKIGGRLTKTINKTIGMYGEMLTPVVLPRTSRLIWSKNTFTFVFNARA